MTPIQLQTLIELYSAFTKRRPSYVGYMCAGSGDFYSRLVAGRDVTTRRSRRVIEWFSDHWPEGLDWPADIPRPVPNPPHGAGLASPKKDAA